MISPSKGKPVGESSSPTGGRAIKAGKMSAPLRSQRLHFYFPHNTFYWSIIASQCCVSFCCTMKRISHAYTYIPSLLSLPCTPPQSHPSKSSQSTKLSFLCFIVVPTSYLFYTWYCIYVSPNLPVCPSLPFPTTPTPCPGPDALWIL